MQTKCFKDDFAKGQVMDMFLELFSNIDVKYIKTSKQGIQVSVFDPSGREVETYQLLQETHKGFQKIIQTNGVHRICIHGSRDIFNKDVNIKYEMSIQIEGTHVHADTDEHAQQQSGFSADSFVTREHIDKVDIEIDLLLKKAETIVQDQRRQRERQLEHQNEYERFSSNFVLIVSVQISVIVITVVWQIISLKNFFVQKNIF
eukprot:403372758